MIVPGGDEIDPSAPLSAMTGDVGPVGLLPLKVLVGETIATWNKYSGGHWPERFLDKLWNRR